jgi:hypothetical protein
MVGGLFRRRFVFFPLLRGGLFGVIQVALAWLRWPETSVELDKKTFAFNHKLSSNSR